MSNLPPSQFATPGNPADTLPEISPTQSPSGTGGRSATANNEGESILGAEARILADEAGEGPLLITPSTSLKLVYVAPWGSDLANGLTTSTPVKTVVKGLTVMGASTLGVLNLLGMCDGGSGVSMSGYACGIIGIGDASGIYASTTQTGPMLDLTGYEYPNNAGGENIYYRRPFRDFQIIGDGTADATNTNKGMKLGVGASGETYPTGLDITNVTISATGGTPFDGGIAEWCHIDVVCNQPVAAGANSIPYFAGTGDFNANEVKVLCRSLSSGAADMPAGGAVQIKDDGVSRAPTGNDIVVRTENLHVPTNGRILYVAGSYNEMDFLDYDSVKVTGATGTSYIYLDQPSWAATGTLGGNQVVRRIPGAYSLDAGVIVNQPNNSITGIKFYDGTNIVLNAGVQHTSGLLLGQVSGASNPAVVDNSGETTNLILEGGTSANAPLTAVVGAILAQQQDADPSGITNQLGSTLTRPSVDSNAVVAATSGSVRGALVKLYAGQVVGHLQWWSGSTAAVTPTNQWMGIADSSGHIVALTADQTTAAIAANSLHGPYAIATTAAGSTTTYTVPSTGEYYIFVCVVAATMPNFTGHAPTTLGVVESALPYPSVYTATTFTGPPTLPTTLNWSSVGQYPWMVATS